MFKRIWGCECVWCQQMFPAVHQVVLDGFFKLLNMVKEA